MDQILIHCDKIKQGINAVKHCAHMLCIVVKGMQLVLQLITAAVERCGGHCSWLVVSPV